MNKKNTLLLTIGLTGLLQTANMQAQTPIVDVDWTDSPTAHLSETKDGKAFQCYGTTAAGVRDNTSSWMVNKGTATNPIWARNTNYCSAIQDPATGQWLGTTQNSLGYFLMFYDKDDALGKAFSTKYALETVVRFDDLEGFSYNGSKEAHDIHVKFISSQQGGGWSLIRTSNNEGLYFAYALNEGTETAPKLKKYVICQTSFKPEPGRFYHFVVTADATLATKPMIRLYINGIVQGEAQIDKLPFMFPQCGTTTGQKNMWFCLGGDPGATATPDRAEGTGHLTFADFKIYNTALTATQVKTLYNKPEVRSLTTPTMKKNGLLMDVVFGADQQATDVARQQAMQVAGTPTTAYNADLHRYELTAARQRTGNYFYAPLGAADVNPLLTDGFAIEVYCKTSTALPTSAMTPLGFEDNGGGASLTFCQDGIINFPCHTKSTLPNGTDYTYDAASLTSAKRSLTAEYTHYLLVYDRIGGTGSHLYVNGVEMMSSNTNKAVPTRADYLMMPYAAYQYACVGGDIKGSTLTTACESAFRGNIATARIWGRALSAADAKVLAAQATAVSQTVSVPSSGYTTTCLPFAAIVPAGMEAYIVKAGSKSMELYAKEGEVIPYGTPLILKATEGDYTFEAADLQTQAPKAAPTDNMLEGSFASQPTERVNIYTFVDGKYQAVAPGMKLPAMSAWLSEAVTLPVGAPTVGTYNYSVCGHVLCDGKGVEGVHVSDGIVIATTDADGYYKLNSKKKWGYVFMEIPSGYMPKGAPDAKDKETIFPTFWHSLLFPQDAKRVEEHDFYLQPQPNDHHQMLFGADPQFTGDVCNDVTQYKQVVVPKMKEVVQKAGNLPVYSTMLGDLSFDYKWATFNLQSYHDLLVSQQYPMPHFSVIGNHDHNDHTPNTDSIGVKASAEFRSILGPIYYSFNLGKAHYVVLDDIEYWKNESGWQITITIPKEQQAWLIKDLANVSKSSPVFICMHCPVWKLDDNFKTARWSLSSADLSVLQSAVSGFKEVHVMTGHNHILQVMEPAPNITEHIVMAVGGNMWRSGDFVKDMICDDGTPAGYLLYDINGENVTYKFYSWQHDDAQFRIIDVNEAKKIYNSNATIQAVLKEVPTHTDYRTLPDNSLLVNVFNYDSKWDIQAFEGDNEITCTRKWLEDIGAVISSEAFLYKGPGTGVNYGAINSPHIFLVEAKTADQPITVRVTDRFGNVYSRTVERPIGCTVDGLFPQSDNETGIRAIYDEHQPAVTGIYDLMGRRVSEDASSLKNLPAGFYIVNGKKVVVR